MTFLFSLSQLHLRRRLHWRWADMLWKHYPGKKNKVFCSACALSNFKQYYNMCCFFLFLIIYLLSMYNSTMRMAQWFSLTCLLIGMLSSKYMYACVHECMRACVGMCVYVYVCIWSILTKSMQKRYRSPSFILEPFQ